MLELVTPPAVEPLSVADAKLWARIDGSAFDALLPGMIASARQVAEHELGSRLITQVWREELDDWPCADAVLELYPVQSVDLTYWDGSAWAAVDAGQAVAVRVPKRFAYSIRRTLNGVYPAFTRTVGPTVRADLTVGYGDAPEHVPSAIRQFMAAHIALWVRNPEAASERALIPSPFLAGLLDPFRTYL